MKFEKLEAEERVKVSEENKGGALVRRGRTPLTSPAHAGLAVPHDAIEEWEHFMEYGYLPHDFHGF
jgi:hypothetical protein